MEDPLNCSGSYSTVTLKNPTMNWGNHSYSKYQAVCTDNYYRTQALRKGANKVAS